MVEQIQSKSAYNSVSFPNAPIVYTHTGIIKDKTIIIKGSHTVTGSLELNLVNHWRIYKINKIEVYKLLDYDPTPDFVAITFDDEGNIKVYRNLLLVGEAGVEIQTHSEFLVKLGGNISHFSVLNVCLNPIEIDNVLMRFFNGGRPELAQYPTTMFNTASPITEISTIANARFWVTPQKNKQFKAISAYVRARSRVTNLSTVELNYSMRTASGDSKTTDIGLQPNETKTIESFGVYNYNYALIAPYNEGDVCNVELDIKQIVFECCIDPRFATATSYIDMATLQEQTIGLGSFEKVGKEYKLDIDNRNDYFGQMAFVGADVYLSNASIPLSKANWRKITP